MGFKILLIGLLSLCICFQSTRKINRKLEEKKQENFNAAVNNMSTFGLFAVVKVKNLNTGEIKEVCTDGNFIQGALEIQNKTGKKANQILNKRYIELSDKRALTNVSFFDYQPKDTLKIKLKYDFNKVVKMINKDKKFVVSLSDKEMKLVAHMLFNRGYLTGESNCFGGRLEYVADTKKFL